MYGQLMDQSRKLHISHLAEITQRRSEGLWMV